MEQFKISRQAHNLLPPLIIYNSFPAVLDDKHDPFVTRPSLTCYTSTHTRSLRTSLPPSEAMFTSSVVALLAVVPFFAQCTLLLPILSKFISDNELI